jgi:uncharacterized protein with FMN-binding domain
MKSRRTPMVVLGAVIGLVSMASFRSTPASLTLNTVAPTNTSAIASTVSVAPMTTPTTRRAGSTSPTTSPATTRSATGSTVNYNFGTLAVQVTVDGTKITKITVPSLNDGGNYRSQSIDAMAIPVLTQEAMTAQSANIQSVSGASYTSAGFTQSLQNALTQLGI